MFEIDLNYKKTLHSSNPTSPYLKGGIYLFKNPKKGGYGKIAEG